MSKMFKEKANLRQQWKEIFSARVSIEPVECVLVMSCLSLPSQSNQASNNHHYQKKFCVFYVTCACNIF